MRTIVENLARQEVLLNATMFVVGTPQPVFPLGNLDDEISAIVQAANLTIIQVNASSSPGSYKKAIPVNDQGRMWPGQWIQFARFR
jgi:hypothetical protein